MKCSDDLQLLKKINQGDFTAFKELINRYSNSLFHYINRRVCCREDTQEIVQDIFSSLWKNCSRITITDSLSPYLYKAAKLEVIDWMIKNKRYQSKILELSKYLKDQTEVYNTEDSLVAVELEQQIRVEVEKMPPTMQKAFRMSRHNDMSIKEIAKQLMLSEQTVKNNITLAVSRLRLKFK